MALIARGEDVFSTGTPQDEFHKVGLMMLNKKVYGREGSLMAAMRKPGYHSHPHIHDCEQMNYMAQGELWVYVEDKGYLVQEGDFFRVPEAARHWAWNRSDRPCLFVETHVPRIVSDPSREEHCPALFHKRETPSFAGECRNIFVEEDFVQEVESRYARPEESEPGGTLLAKEREVQTYGSPVDTFMNAPNLKSTQEAFGNRSNIMLSVVQPAYHSHPKIADTEQLLYVLRGELWVFVEDEGYPVRSADFFRVPPMAIHWMWNRSTEPVVLVECQLPRPKPVEPERPSRAVGLFAPGETPIAGPLAREIRVARHYALRVEATLFG